MPNPTRPYARLRAIAGEAFASDLQTIAIGVH
jgi:hypothetical protein